MYLYIYTCVYIYRERERRGDRRLHVVTNIILRDIFEVYDTIEKCMNMGAYLSLGLDEENAFRSRC